LRTLGGAATVVAAVERDHRPGLPGEVLAVWVSALSWGAGS
jgi:hypothetical protein